MSTKTKIIICVITLTAAFGFGRWAAPEKVKTVTKVVTVEKKVAQKNTDAERDVHRETVVTEVTRPDGTKEKSTRTIEDSNSSRKSSSKETDVSKKTDEASKEITRASAKVTITALAAVNVTDFSKPPVYGASISKPILGPITVQATGFTDGRIAIGAGLTF